MQRAPVAWSGEAGGTQRGERGRIVATVQRAPVAWSGEAGGTQRGERGRIVAVPRPRTARFSEADPTALPAACQRV